MTWQIKDYLQFGWQLINGERLVHERRLASMRAADLAPYVNGSQPFCVLDLANGQLCPQFFLLLAAGHRVYGIDKVNQFKASWEYRAYQFARWLYLRKIRSLSKKCDNTLVCGDVGRLPFPTNSFDLVTSIAAFEHFLEVPLVVKEIQRVTRPGGLVWVWIHPFTCLSGGHNLSLTEVPLRSVPLGIDPWDHLRQRKLPFHVPLNEWRIDQYLKIFDSQFAMLKHYCALREGEALLTPEIERELKKYTRDELTCGGYVILARKQGT
jgi:SAM-dependent methyltransferase